MRGESVRSASQGSAAVPPKPAGKRRWRLLVFPSLAAATLCYGGLMRQAEVAPGQDVPSVQVQPGTVERTIRLTGVTAAKRGVMLRAPYLRGSRSRGTPRDFQMELTELVEPGSRVQEGAVVAVFDSESMRNRLDDLKADRVDLEGRYKRLLADQLAEREAHNQKIRVARVNIESAQLDLKTAPVRSAIQAQIFKLSLEEARAAYKAVTDETKYFDETQASDRRALELQLDRARLEEGRAQSNLDRLTVRAPISGLAVSQEIYRGGEFGEVRNGDELRAGQPYLRIVDLGSMIVEANANQVDAIHLRIGDPVHVGFDAYPNLHLSGTLTAIGSIARTGERPGYVAEVPVTISIAGTDPKLIPSLSVSADIVLARSLQTAVLPRDAVSVAVRSGIREGESVALEEPAEWTQGESTDDPPTVPASPGGAGN
jgi:multidrug efflux pump subunit AcrA (membrane-fusion protein)